MALASLPLKGSSSSKISRDLSQSQIILVVQVDFFELSYIVHIGIVDTITTAHNMTFFFT